MEAWLSELEMEWNEDSSLLQDELEMDTFDEELALILGEACPSPLPRGNNNIISSPNLDNPTNLLCQPFSMDQLSSLGNDNNNNNGGGCELVNLPQVDHQTLPDQQMLASINNEAKKQDGNISKRKRSKREASRAYDHIMAERKRRELITERFIALSAIVPGLKKVDKTSILGEAIKYLQQLKGKVTELEEASAKQRVESVVLVKKMQLVVENEDDIGRDNDSPCTMQDDHGNNQASESLPEIEVKYSNKTLLLKVYCTKLKGILAKVFAEVEKHGMIILHGSFVDFGGSALNITVVAEGETADINSVNNLLKALLAVLRAAP